jgi:hypothetical protein
MTNKDEALKMAIELIEGTKRHDYSPHIYDEVINACKEALEQPAQEPVGYWNGSTSFEYQNYGGDGFIVSEFKIDNWKALYTKPQARKFKTLTDDEIKATHNKHMQDDNVFGFARAIEAKLKEKNNG